MDFKALRRLRYGYSPFSALDDCSRFGLALAPLADHRTESVFEALWALFGEYGVPLSVLSDNERCFSNREGRGPCLLEMRLWLLGVRTLHGRPGHPQTQGKIERFHRTIEEELGELVQPPPERAREVYERFLHDYNFERPHEALGMRTPAQVYRPSPRRRPERLPAHEIPEGAPCRKVDASGKLWFKGRTHKLSSALIGSYVQIREEETGYGALYAGVRFASLEDLRV